LFGIDSSKKVILYSGNIGEKQGIEIIIEVAETLKESEAFFLIIGDGAFKKKLQDLAQSKRLENIKFFPLQPIELLPGILNIADFHLVLQKKAAADLVMPSKLTAILSVGGAAIVSAEKGTTLFDIVDQNKMGILIEPESAPALRIAISENLNKDLNEIRLNARYYAQSYLEKEAIMKQFHSFLKNKA
jgi:colanic acid biosynthesis glycosyl transferase WcaI